MDLFNNEILSAAASAAPAPIARLATMGDDAWLAASKALEAEANVVGMARPFYAWQAAAYLYANDSIARWGGALLGDDMGLGKTQVLFALIADALRIRPQGGYAIVVAPTVVEAGYRQDLRAAFPGLSLHVVKGRKPGTLPTADIYLISDDSLTMKAWMTTEYTDQRDRKHLQATPWVTEAAIIVRDEIHRDKGNQAKPTGRAKVMLAVGQALRNIGTPLVAATGTLLTNRPVEAFLPLQIIGGDTLLTTLTPGGSTARSFLWRYCAPKQIIVQGGRKATVYGVDTEECERLHEYLRRTIYCRREKSDLPGDVLPHSGWIVTPLALPADVMTRYKRVEKDLYNLILEEQGIEAAWRAEKNQTLRQIGMLWQEAGAAKTQAAVDYVSTLVEGGDQAVVFYQHNDTHLALAKAFANAGIATLTINGKVTGDARVDVVNDFQAGDVPVVLCNIKAAGMGVTLTAACHAVFVQVPWSAGDLKQAADRILRVDAITRDRAAGGGKVTWHVLQSCYDNGDPTFDAAMWSVLENKAKVCDAVNAGRMITMPEESVMYEALKAWQPSAKRHGGW
jgi:SWI/SNF-related matrix-associated actin-dependent regulator 1 of chromatin subfamily A